MKMVTAIIKPFKLDDVCEALTALGIEGLTITDVKGFGRQKGRTENHQSTDYTVAFLPKIKLEIAIPAKIEKDVIEAIQNAGNTGRIGDGKIFVHDLERAVRIRTGEEGENAL